MVATTSGTTAFSMDIDELIDEAMDYVGGDYTSGTDQAKARRTLNLLLIEMQNMDIPLSKIKTEEVPLVAATSTYVLDSEVSAILGCTVKEISTGNEYTISKRSIEEYHTIYDKDQTGKRPTLYSVERNRDAVTVKVWPVQTESSTYSLQLLTANRIEDVTGSYQKIDLPYRFYPLLVAWLSYKLSMKRQGVPEETKQRLENNFNNILTKTFEEDRERTDMFILPAPTSGR